jgi:hypothetical protein
VGVKNENVTGMLPTENRNRGVEHVRNKAGKILHHMPIQKNEEKR